jgi:hypothetical protein
MEEPAMILNRWYRQPSVHASKDSGTIDRLRRGRGARRRRSQPPSCEVLEARQLLAHTTIAPAVVDHPAALVAGLAPATLRTPAVDPTLEESFLKGVDQQFLGIDPSPPHVAPYLKILEQGAPRIRVLSRLLESPAARDALVTSASTLLLQPNPTSTQRSSMAETLDRGGDLRTLLVSIASSREYYVSQGGGTGAGFRNALEADLLGATTPGSRLPGQAQRLGQPARSALVHAMVFSAAFADGFLAADAPLITGTATPDPGLIAQARLALRRPGGMTRALAILLASDAARDYYAQLEARLAPQTTQPAASSSQLLTVPTLFGDALNFSAVSYTDSFSPQPAPTVALPKGLINQAGNEVTYELWFNAQTSGALLQMQLSGSNNQGNWTFDVPILAVDANGKLTGGLFDVDAGGQLAPGTSGSVSGSSDPASGPITPTLPHWLTTPLTLNYAVNSADKTNSYTYTIVGPNNAMVSAATVLDQNWHEAALVVDGNSERLYLDGLLVGAAQAAKHYSLSFTDASGNTYAPTGAGFLGGTIDPVTAYAVPVTGVNGHPDYFVGSLDEVRVWSVARTADDIAQSMDAPLTLDPTPHGLIGYFDFTPRTKLNGPPLSQIVIGSSGIPGASYFFALDATGGLHRYDGTAFVTTDEYGQPLAEPPATMLAGNVLGSYSADLLSTSGNSYEIYLDGLSGPEPPDLAPPSGTTWIGVSSLFQPWVISRGQIDSYYTWGLGSQWLSEGFAGPATPTSVAPLGTPPLGKPYGGYETWGSVPLRALATDASGNLWINVLANAGDAPSPWVRAAANITAPLSQVYAGADGSVWAIDNRQDVYRMDSVTLDGSTYDCHFVAMPLMHGTTSLSVDQFGDLVTITSGVPYEWYLYHGPQQFANLVPGSPFGPATNDPAATGTSLSATDVVAAASTIPADPFDGVPRLPGYQDFAPYLAVPFTNSASTVTLAAGSNQVEYQVTLNAGDTVIVEVPGQQVHVTTRVDFLGFTTNPADGSHPTLASYAALDQVSGDRALNDLIQSNMAAAFPAPASGTYLIQITIPGPAQVDRNTPPPWSCSSASSPARATAC